MLAYFKDPNENPIGVRLTTLLLFALAIAGVILAEQIITGWLALGPRANISRRDINFIEWFTIALGLVYSLAVARAAWGIYKRDEAGWAWSQWITFLSMFFGFAMAMRAILPVLSAYATGDSVPDLQTGWLIIGGVLFFANLAAYNYVTRDVIPDDSASNKKQGALGTEVKDMTPTQYLRYQLAKSPSAGAIIGFVIIFLGFSFATDLFLQPRSIASILTNISSKGIIAIGVTILMISGEFDLSVGSMLGAVSTFFMLFLTEGIAFLGIDAMPVGTASIAALIVACFLGLINGMILVRTGIPSFIVTLGTLLAYRAIPLVAIPGGRILRYRDYFDEFPQVFISRYVMAGLAAIMLLILLFVAFGTLPNLLNSARENWKNRNNNGHFGDFQAIVSILSLLIMGAVLLVVGVWLLMVAAYHLGQDGMLQVGFFDIANGRWEFTMSEVTNGLIAIEIPVDANFRNSIVWWLLLVALFHVILTQTPYGNAVYAVGGNPGAARAQGINVSRIKVLNFVLLAFLVGVTAIFEVARNPGVDPLKGELWELEVIAMTVIGGALLTGGYGSIIGTLLGVLIFGMLQTGLVLIGVNARLFQGVVGVILIVAVVLNTSVRRIPNK